MTYIISRDSKILDGWFGYNSRRTQAATVMQRNMECCIRANASAKFMQQNE